MVRSFARLGGQAPLPRLNGAGVSVRGGPFDQVAIAIQFQSCWGGRWVRADVSTFSREEGPRPQDRASDRAVPTPRGIFLARGSLISGCPGTASITAVAGLIQSDQRKLPSRLSRQPSMHSAAQGRGACSDAQGQPPGVSRQASAEINLTISQQTFNGGQQSSLACPRFHPCPFAPGSSRQMAQKPPCGAGSIPAVSSPFMAVAPSPEPRSVAGHAQGP